MADELEGLQELIPQRKALSMSMMPDVKFNSSDPQITGGEKISRKIGKLVREEGKTRSQAAGQAFGQARQGDLGPAAKRAAGRKPS